MKIAVFDAHGYDQEALEKANQQHGHELTFFEPRLTPVTAPLARGYPAVCSFVNDQVNAATLELLCAGGTRLIALRSAGYNHVDLPAARQFDLAVTRVPEYSPYAVAEHAVGLILCLNRKIHRAYNRVRDANFSLEGLVGFDLFDKTFGLVGTGRIGITLARIMGGFGCRLLAYDIHPDPALAERIDLRYVPLSELYAQSDIISLHVPLVPDTFHLLNAAAFAQMKPDVMIVNTGRGALVDSRALLEALKHHRIGAAALDVYEEEEGVFFSDHSARGIQDDVLARLLTFPNVLVTSHQAFLTREALHNIAATTLQSVTDFERGEPLRYQVAR
jgi:D-lactate dehydrogenase